MPVGSSSATDGVIVFYLHKEYDHLNASRLFISFSHFMPDTFFESVIFAAITLKEGCLYDYT